MSLLAPLFLLGGLAIALPLWLHRLQTQSPNRQAFSSAMLLESTRERVHVRKQLKYRLLLAMRIALLLLAALAFAQPFLERPPAAVAGDGEGSTLVVIDASASMGRSGVLDQALGQARRAIDEATPGAMLQVLVAGSRVRELLPASVDAGSHASALGGLEVEEAHVDFGELMAAAESAAERLPPPVTLHLVSDFQASAMPAQFADVVPAGVAAFLPHVVGTGDPVNWSIAGVRESGNGVEVIVENQGLPDRTTDIELRINGEPAGVRAAGGQGRHVVGFGDLDFVEGDNRVEVRLVTDDDLAVDNRWFAVVRREPPQPVPLITRNPDSLPVTYLSAALESLSDARFTVDTFVPGDFDPRILVRHDWAIIDDIGSIDAALAGALGDYLENGGNLLAFAGDAAMRLQTLPVSGRTLAPADLGSGIDAFRRIGSIDDQHPALAGTEGWYRVRVARSIALELDGSEQILVRLDTGAPLIIEEQHGSGRLLLVLSAADNRWNDLPVNSVFVGFMIEAADYLSGRIGEFGSYTAGDSLSLAASGAGQVVDPDGENLLSLAATAAARPIRLEKAGIYTVYTAEGESLVAANVDPRESDLAPMGQDVLERWRDATYSGDSRDSASATDAATGPLEFAPWLLLVLAVVVIAESALANVHIATRMRAT